MSTGKSVFGWIEGPEEIGGGEQDAPSSSSVFMTQVPTNTWQESFNCVYWAFILMSRTQFEVSPLS